jgi:DedD protein
VQLGSFATARNAHALRDRLKSKGYKAFARSSGSGVDAVTRVYVGPDATRDAARQRVSRLLGETRLKGFVVRNPG